MNLWQLMNKSVTVFLEMVFTKSIFGVNQESQGAILRELIELLLEDKIKSPIKHTFNGLSVDNIRRAHTILEQRNTIGKIVINF